MPALRQEIQGAFTETEQPQWVHSVHRIIKAVAIPIRITACITNWIRRGLSAGEGVLQKYGSSKNNCFWNLPVIQILSALLQSLAQNRRPKKRQGHR
jgi:hypothetical protein